MELKKALDKLVSLEYNEVIKNGMVPFNNTPSILNMKYRKDDIIALSISIYTDCSFYGLLLLPIIGG